MNDRRLIRDLNRDLSVAQQRQMRPTFWQLLFEGLLFLGTLVAIYLVMVVVSALMGTLP